MTKIFRYLFHVYAGFNPDVRNERDHRTTFLFQELWKFNIMTQRWSKVFSSNADADRLPVELASNAIVMRGDMLVVSGFVFFFFSYCITRYLVLFEIFCYHLLGIWWHGLPIWNKMFE